MTHIYCLILTVHLLRYMASLATARLGVQSRHIVKQGKTLRHRAETNAVLFCVCQGDLNVQNIFRRSCVSDLGKVRKQHGWIITVTVHRHTAVSRSNNQNDV